MNCWRKRCKWGGISRVAPFIFFVLLLVTLMPFFRATPARADGGIAISGSFYRQVFEIPQGSSVSGPSVYVTVFNQSSGVFSVDMTSAAPTGVTVTLSHDDFTLQPGSQQQVWIAVAASEDAVPGYYENGVEVTALAWTEGGEGIQILGAAAQNASLLVTGEWARVLVDSVGPNGQPVATQLRLFKVINGQNYEYSHSNTGHLEATVSPGSYVAYSYNNGTELALQSFEVAAGEEKQVTLTVNTIYFSHFEILPAYNDETGELGFVQVSYTVKNVYQQMASASVSLTVTLDGDLVDEGEILNLSPLNLGDFGAPYTYIPASGWRSGTYGFTLRLYVDVQLYAGTQEQTLEVGVGSESALPWWIFVLAALGGGLIIGGIIVFLRRRKKQDKPEKAQKARKHEKKESPAEGEEAGGIVYGLKRLFSRKGKAAKKQAAPAKGTAPAGAGVVVHSAAKKEAPTGAQAQQARKEAPAIDVAKPAAERPSVTQAAPAQASVAAQPTTVPPIAATAQASTAAKAEAVQPAVAQEAKPVQAAAAPAPKPAQATPAHVKSAADLKKAIASRQADSAMPAATGTAAAQSGETSPLKDYAAGAPGAAPASTTPAAVATPRRDPLAVPSPFAAPREGPPAKKARYARVTVPGARAASTPHAAAPAAGTEPAKPEAAAVKPETIEPLPVPSPFAAPRGKPYAEKPAPATPAVAEVPEAAALQVEPTMAPAGSVLPEAEPVREPAVETAASVPAADLDVEPVVMQENAGVSSSETGSDAGEPATPGGGQPEGQASESQAQDDEAAKKFVSPIRFLNR